MIYSLYCRPGGNQDAHASGSHLPPLLAYLKMKGAYFFSYLEWEVSTSEVVTETCSRLQVPAECIGG